MAINPGKPWLVDGRTGETVPYGQLLERLAGDRAGMPPLFQPASTQAALHGITTALISDMDLVLFDADFGSREIESLGFVPARLNQPVAAPAVPEVTVTALARLAAGASKARLGLFTSGSTGLPKLVWQSAANLARAVKVSPRRAEAVWALAYNPTHVAGIQVYLQALANGCTVVDVYGLDRAFYRLLLPVDRPLAGVKSVTLGGESADARLLARLAELFPAARIHNVYASTEAGTLLVAEGDVFGIAAGLEDKVVVRDGRIHVHRSLLGEFASKGQTTADRGRMSEASQPTTYNSQPTTAAAQDAAWYDTGDVVEVVAGEPLRFRIVARERDWVNVGGSKVNPHEVEAALAEHPGVGQVRVFGRKNSVMGNILCAEVVARTTDGGQRTTGNGQLTEAVLREFAAARLQPFKVPRMIRFVDSLATTRTGKLFRT